MFSRICHAVFLHNILHKILHNFLGYVDSKSAPCQALFCLFLLKIQNKMAAKISEMSQLCHLSFIFLGDCIDFGNVMITLHKLYLLKFIYYNLTRL